jgi:hypothetical protein
MTVAGSPLRDKLIFVVGARRSGTNWLHRVLAAHPDVLGVPSETYVVHALRPLRDRFHQGSVASPKTGWVYVRRDAMVDRMRDLCDEVFLGLITGLDPAAKRIVERTPDHVRDLDLIGEIYPDAHVVHIIRDGRDVVRSLMGQEWGPSSARDAVLEWRSAIDSARNNAPSIANYHEVFYEDLLRDPLPRIIDLYTTLGLGTSESELEAALEEVRVLYNASTDGATSLRPELLAVVDEAAGDLIAQLGYGKQTGSAPLPRESAAVRVRRLARDGVKRARSEAVRLRSRVLRRRPELTSLEVAQQTLDRFLDAATNDPARVLGLLTAHARIRIIFIDGEERIDARGPRARQQLVQTLRDDAALRGTQVVGYTHPSQTMLTFVGVFEVDGARHPRALVLTLEGDRIGWVAYYLFTPA